MSSLIRYLLGCGLAISVASVQSQTSTVNLGTFSAPATFDLSTSNPAGVPFENWWVFRVADGATLSFSARLGTGGRGGGSDDMDAQLFRGNSLVAGGDARTQPPRPGVPEGPYRYVDFANVALDSGDYRLEVTGTVFGRFPDLPFGNYTGNGTLSLAAPVPEPTPAVMLGAGMVVLGIAARRRRTSRRHG